MLDPHAIAAPILDRHGLTLEEIRASKDYESKAARRDVVLAMREHFTTAEIGDFVRMKRSALHKVLQGPKIPKVDERKHVSLDVIGRGMRDADGPRYETCKHYGQCLAELLKRERTQKRFPEKAACPALCKHREDVAIGRHNGERKAVDVTW